MDLRFGNVRLNSLPILSSLFLITVLLKPQDLSEVEDLICTHVAELATCPIPDPELARAKRLLCNEYIFSTESPDQVAGLYGYYQTIAQAELAITYPDQVRSFQVNDLQDLANHYLSPHHYAAIVLKPR